MKREVFKNIKILYVEDEENIRANAVSYLKRLFDEVYEAKDGLEALKIIKEVEPEIIISDIKMPKMSGLEMVKKIREENSETQIIILSAFTDTNYLISAVELGLVKYMIKPIRHDKILPVLLQCAKNIKENSNNLKYLSEDCFYDVFNKTLLRKDKIIKLSKNELLFLDLLHKNDKRVVTYEEIESQIWYDSYMSEDAIRSLVRNLRKNLPEDSLINIAKMGYRIKLLV